jgi:hypothetical protein
MAPTVPITVTKCLPKYQRCTQQFARYLAIWGPTNSQDVLFTLKRRATFEDLSQHAKALVALSKTPISPRAFA